MWVSKVHRQHNSLVITLNAGMCRAMGINRGDYLQFEVLDDKAMLKKLLVKRVAGTNEQERKSQDKSRKLWSV